MPDPLLAFPYRIGANYRPAMVANNTEAAWITANLPTAKVAKVFEGVSVYMVRASPGQVEFFVPTEDGLHLDYYMACHTVFPMRGEPLPEVLLKRASFQASVYRTLDSRYRVVNLAPRMFWTFLLSGRRNVMSDNAQSDAGEAFWHSRVTEAFNRGLRVYGVDAEQYRNNLIITQAERLHKPAEMTRFYTQGMDLKGHYKRLVIAKP